MRGQVPDDIDVVLKEAEVYAGRIVIIQFAQNAIVHELANLSDRARKQERVIDHQDPILSLRQLD